MRSSRSIPSRRGRRAAARRERKTAVQERAEAAGDRGADAASRCETRRSRRGFAALDADLAVVAAYGLILPKPILEAPKARLPQRPRLAAAALARRGADPARDPRRRRGHRRDHHADGRRARHRARCCSSASSTFAARMPGKSRKNWRNSARRRCSNGSTHPTPPEPQPTPASPMRPRSTRPRRGSTGQQPAAEIERQVRAFNPVARRLVRGERRADQAARSRRRHEAPGEPGEVLDDRLTIACGEGCDPAAHGPARRARRR